jgi:hypothetical protein
MGRVPNPCRKMFGLLNFLLNSGHFVFCRFLLIRYAIYRNHVQKSQSSAFKIFGLVPKTLRKRTF